MPGPQKGNPLECWYQGRRYVSVAALKTLLGLSKSKVMRLERQGVIPRPEAIPRGSRGTRWYLREEVERIAETLEDGGEVDWSLLGGSDGAERRPWADYARPGRRRAREQVCVDDEDEQEAQEWVHPAAAAGLPAPREVERCPVGGCELTWDTQQVPRCPRHGVVDLRAAPEPTEGTCVRCGGEVLWQTDATVPGGFAAVCERCGVTEVHPPKAEHEREKRWANFGVGAAAVGDDRRAGRPRGLALADVVSAIRTAQAAPPSRHELLPPYEGSGGPR